MPEAVSLLAEFRRTIRDVRHSMRAFGFGISDSTVTSAILEVTDGRFTVTVIGGSQVPPTPSLDLDLSNPRYDTVGRLYQVLSRAPGYRCTVDEDADLGHTSLDLEPFGPLNVGGSSTESQGVDIRTHRFSDFELEELLHNAIQRHNPSFQLATMPAQEYAFVLPLAMANVLRLQAGDAAKRKGLSETVADLLALAGSYEEQYTKDTDRLKRALHSPKEANSNTTDEGDVMLGNMYRRSMRTGFMSPLAMVIKPSDVVLKDPDERDIEDDNVRVVWQRNRDVDFYSYELWMDATPDVVRTREGSLVSAGIPLAFLDVFSGPNPPGQRLTTSRMVFRSFGPNSNASRSSFATFVEEFGQLISSYACGALESTTTYYWRLYVIDVNYIAVGSNVVKATTKPLRCRFMLQQMNPNNPSYATGPFIDNTSGPPGTVFNITCSPNYGQFTAAHQFRIGPKILTAGSGLTITDPYHIAVTVPTFQNIQQPFDLSIISPTKLVDVQPQSFTVTSS